jgi:ubiquitin carboxyl-terminal hydrolase 4/11
LIAVDDHWGGLGGGHYTAFARNFVDGEWYEYNGMSNQPTLGTHAVANSYQILRCLNRKIPGGL